jgi:hypothetical protein
LHACKNRHTKSEAVESDSQNKKEGNSYENANLRIIRENTEAIGSTIENSQIIAGCISFDEREGFLELDGVLSLNSPNMMLGL